ncbi:MAG: aminotransferase class I/II-fold pyridoxal phosphate-dependent enzyme, partial [Tumebacillaceae bacterium]
MQQLLNKRVVDIKPSGIRKFANLVANYKDAIGLTLGQPDFPTPEHVKQAAKNAIDDNRTTYTVNPGLLDLRLAACDFVLQKYNLSYKADEVIVTVGGSEAIDIALRTILTEGSEVILPGPVYPGYEPLIQLAGGVPVHVETRDTEFKITAERLEAAITERTRCVILPYPSNPTGCLLTEQELRAIADVLKDRNIFVISDEIYSELIYEGRHNSIAAIPEMREKTIVINGLSKSHSMTGWRVGLTFAPTYITSQMLKVHSFIVACASSISQHASLEALTSGVNDAEQMKVEYRKRRDYVYGRLLDMGMECVKAEGAFYLFPSIEKFGMTSLEFATRLLEEQRVAIVPGDAFSS